MKTPFFLSTMSSAMGYPMQLALYDMTRGEKPQSVISDELLR